MKEMKQTLYKLIVIFCIVLTMCSFMASTPVYSASKVSEEFYYSGTSKGSYTVEKGFLEKLIDALAGILDFLLGFLTMGLRMVVVGWTVLLERCLTWILEGATGDDINIDKMSATAMSGSDDYITIDAIFFNRVPLLDVNFFDMEVDITKTATGFKSEFAEETAEDEIGNGNSLKSGSRNSYKNWWDRVKHEPQYQEEAAQEEAEKTQAAKEEKEKRENSLVMILKRAIAGWYYIFRAISFMLMLIILVYIGIKLAISSATKDKAFYKRVLMDWVVGMILVFSIHYIMLGIIKTNEIFIDTLAKYRDGAKELEVYEYGLKSRAKKPVENDELEVDLYTEVKTRAYDAKLSVGTTGMIMYMVLVFYAWKYTFIYLKRYLTVAVLTMIAPLVAATYAFNKVNSGKSTIFTNWFKEYLFTVIIQTMHALLYLIFLDTALKISLQSVGGVILAFTLMHMMSKSESLFRKILNINGKLTDELANANIRDTVNAYKGAVTGLAGAKLTKAYMEKSTRALTAPLKKAGELTAGKAFVGHMKKKAEKLDARPQNEKDAEKQKEQGRLKNIRNASLAHAIKTGSIDVGKLSKAVDSLELGQDIVDDDGRKVGEVTQDYIDSERNAIKELEAIQSGKFGSLDELDKQYKKNTSRIELSKQHIGKKWKEIMDPYQYVKKQKVKVRDKNGNILKDENGNDIEKEEYKAIEKKRQDNSYESPLGKAIFGGKVTDSSLKRLKDNLKLSNLRDFTPEQKAQFDANMKLAQKGITGFFGIMVGLPLMVEEPKLGIPLLYKGVSDTHSFRRGITDPLRKQKISINAFRKMDPKSRYILTGFAGGSINTIANVAQSEARQEVAEIGEAHVEYNRSVVRKTSILSPKLAFAFRHNSGRKEKTGKLHGISNLSRNTSYSVKPGSVSATKAFARSSSSNKYVTFTTLGLEARKHKVQKYEQEVEYGYSNSYLDELGDLYLQSETDQIAYDYKQKKEKVDKYDAIIIAEYKKYLTAEKERIDNLSDEELLLENNLETPITFEDSTDSSTGTIRLSVDSETSIIDNAIIKTAMQMSILDINELEKSSVAVSSVKREIDLECKKRGVVKNSESSETVIEDVDKKIKKRLTVLGKTGRKAVKEKLIDDSIVEVMKRGDSKGNPITDPKKVKIEEVEKEYQARLDSISGRKPTKETSNVVTSMNTEKMEEEQPKESNAQAIMARKSILSERIKNFDVRSAKELRAQLKHKTEVSLDSQMLETDEKIKSGVPIEEIKKSLISKRDATPVSDANSTYTSISNATSNPTSSSKGNLTSKATTTSSDSILEILNLQTEKHKKENELVEYVEKKSSKMTETSKKRLAMSLEEVMSKEIESKRKEQDGSRRLDSDGSRRLTSDGSRRLTSDGSIRVSSDGSREITSDGSRRFGEIESSSSDIIEIIRKAKSGI